MPVSRDRLICIGLMCIGVALCVFGALRLLDSISSARTAGLATAQQTVSQTLVPALASGQSLRVRQATTALVSANDNPISYLTVRNSQGRLLASAGRHDGVFGWLPTSASLSWRAWLYRSFSAETLVPLAGQTVGLGVSWSAILIGAMASWVLWALACLIGLGCAARAARQWSRQPVSPASSTHRPATARAPVQKRPANGLPFGLGRHRETRSAGQPRAVAPQPRATGGRFKPWIARLAVLCAKTGAAATNSSSQLRPAGVGGFEVIGSSGGPSTAEPVPQSQVKPVGALPTSMAVFEQTPTDKLQTRAAVPPSCVDDGSYDEAPSPRATHEAVSDGASPVFGERTLNLGFRPIWRGPERSQLAGGWVTLSWRSGDGEPVSPASLAELAEQEGALRAFAQWIAERLAMLQANWRTLELPTVPIVLPVPPSLFAVQGARHIWAAALERVGRGRRDLVLQIEPSEAGHGLAMRQARTAAIDQTGQCADIGAGNLVFVRPDKNNGCEAAQRALSTTRYPILVGPLLEPLSQSELLDNHQRVAWFTEADNDNNLYTPRGFARLMSQQALAPL